MKTFVRATLAIALVGIGLPAAAEYSVTTEKKDPPEVVSEEIAKTLEGTAVIVMDGDDPLYEFWFAKEITLKGKPAEQVEALEQIKPMAVLGAAVSHVEQYDYRDDEVFEDTYVMRFALQPADGNHLGTAEFDSFALLLPAKIDTKVDQWDDPDAMVEASAAETFAEHPIILLMRPQESADKTPAITAPVDEEQGVRLKLKGSTGKESVDLIFDLIVEGHGEL